MLGLHLYFLYLCHCLDEAMAIAFKKDGAAGWRDEMGHLAMLTRPLSITNLPSLERQQKHPPE